MMLEPPVRTDNQFAVVVLHAFIGSVKPRTRNKPAAVVHVSVKPCVVYARQREK